MAQKAAKLLADATTIKAKGEQQALEALALGQKAQKEVLGDKATVQLRMFETALKALESVITTHPEVVQAALANASKVVPQVVVMNNGGGGSSLDGAAAVLGQFMHPIVDAIPAKVPPSK